MGPTLSYQGEGNGEFVRGTGGGGLDLERTGVGLEVFLVGKERLVRLGWGWGRGGGGEGKTRADVDFFRRECEGLQF